jgi:hypothetical protein
MNTMPSQSSFPGTDKNITPMLVSTFQSFLKLFFALFPIAFVTFFLHEGGHALASIAQEVKITSIRLYIHPFAFSGFSRPIGNWYSVWTHTSGHLAAILVSLLIFILLWRRRSSSNLPLVMLFPYIAIGASTEAFQAALPQSGDFYNILTLTGLPPAVFYGLGAMLFIVGVFFFVTLLPLAGLAPGDLKSLFVIPAAIFSWRALSAVVANIVVPGSSIDVQYHLGSEILASANSSPVFLIVLGLLLAVIFIVLYRILHLRMPARLRTDKVYITWRGLLSPALLWAFCIVLGLIIMR